MKKTYIPFLLGLTLLGACGGGGGGGGGGGSVAALNPQPATVPELQEEQPAEGSYRAILRPYNNSLSGFLPSGVAEISISGDNVKVKTLLDDDAKVMHMQSIQMGTRCPVASDDKNQDGFIDIEESYAASGEVFIPLDFDLDTAEEGAGLYPKGQAFTYIKTASLSNLEADTSARTGQDLNLAGRVVIIHGAAPQKALPPTVATRNGLSRELSIPIACGTLTRQ